MDKQLLKKLNYKDDDTVLVINPPDNYKERIKGTGYLTSPDANARYTFVQAFCYKKADIPKNFKLAIDHLEKGGKLWFCYAKKSSELYTDISRDDGWDAADTHGFIAVRQVAINDDWSALRFKPEVEVKNITRGSALQEISIPPSIKKALDRNPFCRDTFNNLSQSNQREYIRWVTSAKREETVKKRLNGMIEKLKEGKKNPFDQ